MNDGDVLFTICNISLAMHLSRFTWPYWVPAIFNLALWGQE